MSSERSDHKMKAKLCEHAERYDDMVTEMTALIKGEIYVHVYID